MGVYRFQTAKEKLEKTPDKGSFIPTWELRELEECTFHPVRLFYMSHAAFAIRLMVSWLARCKRRELALTEYRCVQKINKNPPVFTGNRSIRRSRKSAEPQFANMGPSPEILGPTFGRDPSFVPEDTPRSRLQSVVSSSSELTLAFAGTGKAGHRAGISTLTEAPSPSPQRFTWIRDR